MKSYLNFVIVCLVSLYATEYAASAQTQQEIQQQIDATKKEKEAAIKEYEETLAEFKKQGFTSESWPYFKAAVQDIADLISLISILDNKMHILEYSGKRMRFYKGHRLLMDYRYSVHKQDAPTFDKEVGKILIEKLQNDLLIGPGQEKELARIRARKTELHKVTNQPQQEPATPERLQQLSEQQKKEAIILPHQPGLRELITEYIVEKPKEQCGNK